MKTEFYFDEVIDRAKKALKIKALAALPRISAILKLNINQQLASATGFIATKHHPS